MKKRAAKRKPRGIVVPPIAVGFEEAVSRLLKVKPEPRSASRAKSKKKKLENR